MDTQTEKHLHDSAADVESPVSPISEPPKSHGLNGSVCREPIPKRKPLPWDASVPNTESSANVTRDKRKPGSLGANLGALLCLDWYRYASQRKKRRVLIIGAIVIVLLLALIIGLSVGLTVGKKNSSSNLPLPSSHGGPYEGDLTYYNPALGSCGYTNSDSDLICAVSHVLFDAASTGSNPNENPLCGMKLRLRRNGKSVDVKVVDRCVGCKETDLDVTEAVFEKVAELDQGRVLMEWSWLEEAPVTVS
ncbi:hypothetical protein N7450_000970 [Penicillium hetheringtonii]|uniref:RlpA-like protein double-psi beta-barrel domain-containing protein n=1 Tax=Penicillium hetheringtonii TaxID=911720 RepID=A0AAD6E329_9EURO|nr:hypothetical protein N7450_000970 [Penicillium hetheringtonii]